MNNDFQCALERLSKNGNPLITPDMLADEMFPDGIRCNSEGIAVNNVSRLEAVRLLRQNDPGLVREFQHECWEIVRTNESQS